MSMKPSPSSAGRAARARWLPTALAAAVLCGSVGPAPLLAAPPAAASRAPRAEPVTLNFVNAEIEGVARAMSAILNQQFVVDPRVKGTMTLYSETPLSPREAYLNFLAALRGLGFTVVDVNGLHKIVPEADAKLQTGTVAIGETPGRRGDQVMTQVFRLTHENANNLVPVLRPLISPNNTINANPGNNTLVVTDYADNLARIGKIIAAMDVPAAGDVEVIPLKYAAAADIAPLVQRLTDSTGAAAAVPGGQAPAAPTGAAGATVMTDPRSNSLLVRAPNAARLASIRALVDKLDRPAEGTGAAGNVWVVYLKNADAVKLATVLRASYGSSVGSTGGGMTNTSFGGAASPTGQPTTAGTTTGSAAGASPQATTPVQAGAGPSTGGFVQADPSTNSLIITAPEPLYRQIRALIDQLDSRRAQVYIESMIVEVSGDNSADFGFQWQGLLGNSGDRYGVVGGTNFNAGNSSNNNIITISTIAAGLGSSSGTTTGTSSSGFSLGEGLNIGLVRNYGGTYALAAIARALQAQTNTNIVSTPNLITLDNEEAKIIVGSNVPFITGQYTNTGTATTSPFQTIERKDVGITLRIKPQIGEGGTVRMQIFQESSSVSSTTAPGTSNAGPSTDKRSIESTVVVDDGSILVLGGLIQDKYSENKSKVPLLGDIPVVGGLFRSESRSKTRTNLMVFLRPVIMRDADSLNKLSLDRYDMIRATQKEQQPSHSILVPINEAPVVPPLRASEPAASAPAPLAVPPSSPGTEPGAVAPRPPASAASN
jgi:general secretion pathway protein D